MEGNEKEEKVPGDRPEFRIVQAGKDSDGNTVYTNVGGIWKAMKSKNGKEYANMRIGHLKLLVFKNDPKK